MFRKKLFNKSLWHAIQFSVISSSNAKLFFNNDEFVFNFKNPPPHLGPAKVAALVPTTATVQPAVLAVNVATTDVEATSRKRVLVADDFDDSNNKRPCLETAPEKNFDQAIAEIVAVIDEESKMLGNNKSVLPCRNFKYSGDLNSNLVWY